MVVHTCHPTVREAEAGESPVPVTVNYTRDTRPRQKKLTSQLGRQSVKCSHPNVRTGVQVPRARTIPRDRELDTGGSLWLTQPSGQLESE